MKRRQFIKNSAVSLASLPLFTFPISNQKSHILTLSFDDGFKKSFYRIAEIHETYGLQACLNVIATGHLPEFDAEPDWIQPWTLGDFEDWNKLKGRGHEIMPHTWDHRNATEISLNEAKEGIDQCLEYFEENLSGYSNGGAVYNFAYNASTPEIDAHALKKVAAVRTGGWLVLEGTMVNPINEIPQTLGCWGHGPGFCDDYVEMEVNKFLASNGGWLILNLHGLDQEGWGPVSTAYLDQLLKRLVEVPTLDLLPAGEVLKKYA